MERLDDGLSKRKFDNLNFVPFYDTVNGAENPSVAFSIAALDEIPDQYTYIKKHFLGNK
jgi:hypothetical protein